MDSGLRAQGWRHPTNLLRFPLLLLVPCLDLPPFTGCVMSKCWKERRKFFAEIFPLHHEDSRI